MSDAATIPPSADPEGWAWWEARRPTYNLALAIAGWLAYALAVGQSYLFGRQMWESAQGAISMTLFLGTAYLVLMGFANICFLLGVLAESWARPADRDVFRRRMFAMGLWGSVAVPFLFPLVNLALLIGGRGV